MSAVMDSATANADCPEGYMRDGAGNLIAIENIRAIDMARHELVMEMLPRVKALSEELEAAKKQMLGDIDSFVELSAERYGAKLGGKKGNVALESFCGRYRVERAVAEHITFDEGLQAAKALIDDCLREWAEGSNADLRTLVDHTFRVDKKGKLNTGAILGLRRLNITDERWQNAMQAISDSIKVMGSCIYVRFYERTEGGAYKLIPLDMAAV